MANEVKVIWTVAEEIPYAKWIFKGMKLFLSLTGNWDDKTLERTIKIMMEMLQEINRKLDHLNQRVNFLNQRISQVENLATLDLLNNIDLEVKGYAFEVLQAIEDPKLRKITAYKSGLLAETFIDRERLWNWTDLRITKFHDSYGRITNEEYEALEPDFKIQIALPIYSIVLLTWLGAVELETGGNQWKIQLQYTKQIKKHLTFVRNLMNLLKTKIKCKVEIFSGGPGTTHCNYTVSCENKMLRKTTIVRSYHLEKKDANSILCPEPLEFEIDQENAEDENGMVLLKELESALSRILINGTLRVPPPPQFAFFPIYNYAFIYTVGQDGNLYWWKQPPSNNPTEFAKWEGPKKIASGFENYMLFIPAGGNRFYGINEQGDLDWFQHPGFNDGSPGLTKKNKVGFGWTNFLQIVAGSDGVIYGLKENGDLLWYQHGGYKTGEDVRTWNGPIKVRSGWDKYSSIFSIGQGVLYTVDTSGKLHWHYHKGYKTGAVDWGTQKEVGSGWHNFKHIFGTSDGVVFGVQPSESILWYKHESWKMGGHARTWRGPILTALGLGDYRLIFPLMPSEPDVVR